MLGAQAASAASAARAVRRGLVGRGFSTSGAAADSAGGSSARADSGEQRTFFPFRLRGFSRHGHGGSSNSHSHGRSVPGPGMSPRRRALLVAAAGGLLAGGGFAYCLSNPDSAPGFMGPAVNAWEGSTRFLRSLACGALVVVDYKLSMRPFSEAEKAARTDAYREARSKVHKRSAERMLALFRKNGGIYIKAGQHIAAMDHVLPSEYTGTMRVLQDQAPFRPYDDVERVVLEDLGAPPDEVFAEFDRHPLASASLAQVHRARLRDGRECAVKVQYRGLREKCHGDILTITVITRLVTALFPEFDLEWLVDEFKSNLPAELDFKSEGRNSERLARNFAHRRDVHVPRVHWELTTHRVLTMEFIHGCKVNDLEGLQMMRVDPSAVATKLGEVFSEQIFLHGFVHSDPHPGNIMVRPLAVAEAHARQWGPSSVPPSGPSLLSSLLLSPLRRLLSLPGSLLQWPWRRAEAQLVLLDHGLYRELEDSFRLDYARLWKALIVRDMPGIKRYSAALGAPRFEILATMLTARPHHSSKVGLGTKLSKEEVEHLRRVGQEWVTEIVDILASVPRPMLLLFKTNDLLRSVNRDLGASVNPFLIMAAYCVDALNAHALAQRPGLRTLLEAAWAELDLSARLRAYALLLRAAGLWESVLGFAARSLLPAPSTAALDREPFEARGVPPRPL